MDDGVETSIMHAGLCWFWLHACKAGDVGGLGLSNVITDGLWYPELETDPAADMALDCDGVELVMLVISVKDKSHVSVLLKEIPNY